MIKHYNKIRNKIILEELRKLGVFINDQSKNDLFIYLKKTPTTYYISYEA